MTQIEDCFNEDLVLAVMKSINWEKLNLAISWDERLEIGDSRLLEINDLGVFLIRD
jgi:hypothetical protein